MTDLIEIVEELDEMRKPYKVCLCDEPTEKDYIENRYTYLYDCGGVIPLKWNDSKV